MTIGSFFGSLAPAFDKATTRAGDFLIRQSNPMAFGSLAPGNLSPEDRQAQISSALISLGGSLAAAGRRGEGPMSALATGLNDLRQQGTDNATKLLWARATQSGLQDAEEERALKRDRRTAMNDMLSNWKNTDAQTANPRLREAIGRMSMGDYEGALDAYYAQPKAPQVETLYNETTGTPYKAEFDPSSRSWKRIGGSAAPTTGISIGPNGQLVIQPSIPLAKPTVNELQKDTIGQGQLLSQVDRLGDLVDDDFLTYWGQVRGKGLRVMEKAGQPLDEGQKDFISRFTKFRTSTERLFNAYRKEITGAAAAVAELDRLKNSFLNSDMSPTEFRAALGEYQDELKRAMRLKTSLLRQGIPASDERFGQLLDELYLQGSDDNADARFQELQQENPDWAPEQIFERLQAEGY